MSSEEVSEPIDRETEIKFRAEADDLTRLLASTYFTSSPQASDQQLRTRYFDTPADDLAREGIALRIRKAGRRGPVLGLKASLASGDSPFSRTEIEVRSPGLEPDLTLFDAETAAALDRIICQQPLHARFETAFRRRAVQLAWGDSHLEIACDEGHIIAGEQRTPLSEVEIELKEGSESDLYDFATKLAEEFTLKLDVVSKAEKGHFLATGEGPRPLRAGAIRYDTEITLDQAIVQVIGDSLTHFVGNLAALRITGDPAAVHQARVGLRRLRSVLAMLKRALPCPAFEEARLDARRIASALGPVRDYDVLCSSSISGPLGHPDHPQQAQALLARIEEQRTIALRDACEVFDTTDTTLFVLKNYAFLARRGWRHGMNDTEFERLASPASDFARQTLERLHRRALKRGKRLARRTDEERHELRIALKNLRYGVEFFGPLLGRRGEVKRYVKLATGLQDMLGAHNDAATARQLLSDLPPGAELASGFVLGWHARGSQRSDEELLAAWGKFRGTVPFWR